ncbi:MAG: tRNA pseudouridine(38-40) synthase TruA [Bacteroidota bacterium]
MPRYFLDIAYKGTQYAGWQVQPNANTVQAELNKALSTFLRKEMTSLGAGRTDAGVHATQLHVHIDVQEELPLQFFHSINGLLPNDIALNGVYRPVNPELHARFDAISRAYTYQLIFKKNPHHIHDAMWVRQQLDISKMKAAAAILREYKEFGAFCKAHADNHTNFCDIMHAYFEERDHLLLFHIKANRFLRGMVRAVVGTLLMVGSGKINLQEFRQIIESQDRKNAGSNAPAKGLFLVEVAYPEETLELIQS